MKINRPAQNNLKLNGALLWPLILALLMQKNGAWAAATAGAGATAPSSLTVEQAIQLALEKNPQVKAASYGVKSSEAKLGQARASFLPKLGVEARYESFDSSFQKQQGASSNLFLDWNLFNGFQDWNNRRARDFALEQSRVFYEQQKTFIKAEAEVIFYKLLAVVESIKAYEEALKRNVLQTNSAKKRRAAGLASEADILEFDLYQSDLEIELAKLKSDFQQVQAELRQVLGQSDSSVEYFPQGRLRHYHIDETLQQLRERARTDNQGMLAARFKLEQSRASRKAAVGGYLPEVYLSASYGSEGINKTEVSPEARIMGVAKWELFSGFDSYHSVGLAGAELAKAEVELEQQGLSLDTQLEVAYNRLKTVQDRVDLEAQNKTKAKKFFDVVASEYSRGVKNSNDMRGAAQVLLQVITRDIQYRSEFFAQKAELEKIIGGDLKISPGSASGHTD